MYYSDNDDDDIDDYDDKHVNNIIVKNKDISMIKLNKNHYKIEYCIENNATYLKNIMDFNIIRLVYDINKEFFEDVKLNIIDENTAQIFVLMKHLFEDFGMPQRYLCLDLKRVSTDEGIIVFSGYPTEYNTDIKIKENTEPLPLENIKIVCILETDHKINFHQEIIYNQSFNIPKFMEKMAGIIFTKMFLRTKLFIENLNK